MQDGVVLGATLDRRQARLWADKNCEKIHYIADNIYCCGAGTAADTEQVTGVVSSQLKLHRYATGGGGDSRVITSLTMLKQHLFKHQERLSLHFGPGGVDINGDHLSRCALWTR
jgi:20S proteasome subunit beta 2